MSKTSLFALIGFLCLSLAHGAWAQSRSKRASGKAGRDTVAGAAADTLRKGPSLPREHFGIKVYPGATFDAEQSAHGRKTLGTEVFCYHARDGVSKVSAFFQAQPGLTSLGADSTAAWFTREDPDGTVSVTVGNPWVDARTGETHTEDTFIQLLKAK